MVFSGPLVLFDHSHIQTPAHAALFKTGELKLPGQTGKIVGVRYSNFAHNAHQGRNDAVFATYWSDGIFAGHYVASAFRTLCL